MTDLDTTASVPLLNHRNLSALVNRVLRWHSIESQNRCQHPACAKNITTGQMDHPADMVSLSVLTYIADGTELCDRCGAHGAVMFTGCQCCGDVPLCDTCKAYHLDEIDLDLNYDLYKDPPFTSETT